MSNVYNVLNIATNIIVDVIAWDGISDAEDMAYYTSSMGCELQLVTGSDEYYATAESTSSISSQFNSYDDYYYSTYNGNFVGIFTGSFSGEISGSSTGSQTDIILKSQNWTPPTWAKKIKVVCIGGGGGGGAAPADEDGITLLSGGGGGGGGTVTMGEFKIEDIGTGSISIIVGAAGIGGTAFYDGFGWVATGGYRGGSTVFGDYLIALGGNGGHQGYPAESVRGGSPISSINHMNTGGGAGGRGSSNGYTPYIGIYYETTAPSLPMETLYLEKPQYFDTYYGYVPIPLSIAPTGGGGGLGISQPGNVRNDGYTSGGSLLGTIRDYFFAKHIPPTTYNSSSHDYYPTFNAKIGLGGKGGNPYLLEGPTEGTNYGGGGGGAYAGGVTGSYPNGFPNGTPYNFGANGSIGAVIIISET